MTISKLIVEAIEQKKYDDLVYNEIGCLICNTNYANKFFNKKKVLSSNFTDMNMLQNKGSNYICNHCQKLLSGNYLDSPTGKKCGLRLYSFLIEKNKFEIIDKKEKIGYLFNYQFKPPFLLCFSKTGQKHIFYKAKMSNNNNQFYVCMEESNILFNRNNLRKIYLIVNKLFQLGVKKDDLLNCCLSPKQIDKYKISFRELSEIKKYKNDQCYELIIDCLIKEKKNDTNN